MTKFTDRLHSAPGLALAGAALLALGGAVGAGAALETRQAEAMAPGPPVPIASLATASRPWLGEPVVTVRGKIAEVYGSRFVLADGSGRTLVDVGRGDEAKSGLAPNQDVTVQGRYEDGVVRARYLVGADGRVAALGHHGERGHGGHPGHEDLRRDRHGDAPEAGPPPAGNPGHDVAPTAAPAAGNQKSEP
ncbi:MAG: hypothetical protein JWO81_428 [Alphaproteobacteria bacterium]|nr:hypothetical protein [Alphaproteobacteria bacterium]